MNAAATPRQAAAREVTARQRVLTRALPPMRRRLAGINFGVLADISVVGLLGLSMWLIVKSGEQPPILHLTFAIVGVRALAIGRAVFRYAERTSSHNAALAQLAQLRADTFSALIPRVPGTLESSRRGDVLAAFVDDVDQLQDHPLRVRQPLIVSGLVVALSLLLLALLSPLSALILAVLLATTGLLAVTLAARVSGRSDRELVRARAELADRLLERFTSARELAAYGALGQQRHKIDAAQQRLSQVQRDRSRAAGVTGALLALGGGITAILSFVAAAPLLGTTITAPVFAAVVVIPLAVFEIFAQVPQALTARRTVQESADRVAQMTESPLPPEIPSDPPVQTAAPLPMPGAPGVPLIEVRGLAVRHPGQDAPAFADLNFSVAAGDTLVITGESGSGKSTLALALVRLLDYDGSYLVGGVEARTLTGAQLRSIVGLCEQSPHLFDSDLRQNLKFARDTASDAELYEVLDTVGLGDWARARGGLDAPVGERGELVSGGQAQRIALARALLADFPVVVLDEPTAGVDREVADRLISELLGAVPQDRAVLLITHTELPEGLEAPELRLSPERGATAANAD